MSVTNGTVSAARAFHDATKYVYSGTGLDDDAFFMGDPALKLPAMGEQDPALAPLAYKIYTSLDPIPLPRPDTSPTLTALEAIAADGDLPAGLVTPDLGAIAHLLLRSNGLLKTWTSRTGRQIDFRAAGCTGARYHIELYLVCGDLPDLAAGVYHYGAHDHALRSLRSGDFRGALVTASGNEPSVAAAPAILVTSSMFWRNAWRYQARAYRHVFWDTGTVLGNLLAVAADRQLPARTVLGFVDAEVNALIGLDGEHEAAISLVALGRSSETPPQSPAISPLDLPIEQVSIREIEFPEIQAMHHASSLRSGAEVESWRQPHRESSPRRGGLEWVPLQPLLGKQRPTASIDEVIEQRRSFRKYDTNLPLSYAEFSTVLSCTGRSTVFDALPADSAPLTTRFLLVNYVKDLAPGIYVVDAEGTHIALIQAGDVSNLAYQLAVYQEYASDAHVNVYEMADLDRALRMFGNRGYRLAQLEGAIAGAKLQLAAHAFGLGAVGSTSLDDDVTAALSPEHRDLSFMFVAVFGVRRRKSP